jgi:hypothetical protein
MNYHHSADRNSVQHKRTGTETTIKNMATFYETAEDQRIFYDTSQAICA